jgi:1-acyl-sn-glycerol-3-phosphate acyltransferase
VPLEDPRSAIKTLQHTAALLHDGRSPLVFPEGGRSESGVLQEFKDGAAFLAIRAQIPVVPLAMIGLRNILKMHTLTFHRGSVTLRIGQPISTAGMTTHQRAGLTAQMRQKIVEMLK